MNTCTQKQEMKRKSRPVRNWFKEGTKSEYPVNSRAFNTSAEVMIERLEAFVNSCALRRETNTKKKEKKQYGQRNRGRSNRTKVNSNGRAG